MRVAFRADASLQMGSGHVMRCLTLADALTAHGAQCHFVSRAHPGHLLELIQQRGYKVNTLEAHVKQAQPAIKIDADIGGNTQQIEPQKPAHAAWLGSTWQADAQETANLLNNLQPDWLVVDHYALDQRWEAALAPSYKKLLVIDDLADRAHCCDVLLDQNLGRHQQDYATLVPVHCQVFTGPHYALLRPEFAELRPYSLQRRRAQTTIGQLIITMGGVDQDNATGQVLQALKTCTLPSDCRITVVMGLTAPWLQNVQELAAQMPWPTDVVVNVNDMAQRMADSDLAIGAAGSTSWERCCLGLPTLMVVLATNQEPGAQALEATHAVRLIGIDSDIAMQLPLAVLELSNWECQIRMSQAASAVSDGQGVKRITQSMGAVNV
ncbi:UDP-2,4-diacetamido-2,4,6-trideoxy-beta-L-altropyranose hydrolase [Rhodoferax sp.]|uniref:UDP-2,4-diacetamido-2,4, 6-trideoxy-beta-L-altropyranose hydrolase n=1 Tax=Rhodoferax sp. TaxID=50421 RepID=UPI0028409981|nr:UDP-2,4-diacetamido-2,4,6-trideoxy-beta-L-altropyranose hydrolase [Rhodoferax sp.]MDR3371390.1 UDP-2,4-diacetamido-2,4,6-trideoxy-beta-L-altropyranose hydrolase [Rhodoferax sp.]